MNTGSTSTTNTGAPMNSITITQPLYWIESLLGQIAGVLL
jgi:hypothetical protein